MADKKFSSPSGKVGGEALNADYENAAKYDTIRVGALGVFFNEGFRTRYIPYDYMERAFIRVNEVNGRMCCGTAKFAYYRIVFVHDGKEYADVISEKENAFDDALAAIAAHAPTVAIGFKRSEDEQ